MTNPRTPRTAENEVYGTPRDSAQTDSTQDASHTSLLKGIVSLLAGLFKDGDGDSVYDDANNSIKVTIASGAGGGTSQTDSDPFTVESSSFTPVGGVYESTPTALTDGDGGTVGLNANRALKVDATGQGDVPITLDGETVTVDLGVNNDVVISDGGNVISVDDGAGSLTVDGAVSVGISNTNHTGVNALGLVDGGGTPRPLAIGMYNGTNYDSITGTTANGVDVDVTRLPALAAGTNAIGKLAANSGVDIGDVDVTSINGFAAHDLAVAGTPLVLAGAAQTTDDTAPPNRVSAEGDATRLATTLDGAIFAMPHGPQIWDYHLDTSTAQTDTQVHASAGSGLSLYVTDIVFSHDGTAAINLFFEESTTKKLGPYYLPATAGGMAIQFKTPKKMSAATALTFTTSASHAHTVEVTGYTAPA